MLEAPADAAVRPRAGPPIEGGGPLVSRRPSQDGLGGTPGSRCQPRPTHTRFPSRP